MPLLREWNRKTYKKKEPLRVSEPDPQEHLKSRWECQWIEPDGSRCPLSGPLAARGPTYFRHLCYGHGREHNPTRSPIIYDLCYQHSDAWQRAHGMAPAPPWTHG